MQHICSCFLSLIFSQYYSHSKCNHGSKSIFPCIYYMAYHRTRVFRKHIQLTSFLLFLLIISLNGMVVFMCLQMISLLPEEWRPGETLFGCPWQAVVITALVGVVTFTLFFWRTVLAVSLVLLLLSSQLK